MKISYDPDSDIALLELNHNIPKKGRQIGDMIVHVDRDGKPCQIEFLNASTIISEMRQWLRANDAAKYIGVSSATLKRYCREGKISFFQYEREYLFLKEDLDLFLEEHRQSA